jgi:hypothetical protein
MARFLIGLIFLGWNIAYFVNGGVWDFRVSEIMIHSTTATNRTTRWIEIYNAGTDAVSLANVRLIVCSSSQCSQGLLGMTKHLGPNEFFVIGNNDNQNTNGNVKVDLVVSNALELLTSNGSGFNKLSLHAAEELVWSNTLVGPGTSYRNFTFTPGVSLSRYSHWNDTAQNAEWRASTVFVQYGSSGDKGRSRQLVVSKDGTKVTCGSKGTNTLAHKEANALAHEETNAFAHEETNLTYKASNALAHKETNTFSHKETKPTHKASHAVAHKETNAFAHQETKLTSNALAHKVTHTLAHTNTNALPHKASHAPAQYAFAHKVTDTCAHYQIAVHFAGSRPDRNDDCSHDRHGRKRHVVRVLQQPKVVVGLVWQYHAALLSRRDLPQ